MNTLVRFLLCWFSVALTHAAAQPKILFLAVDDLRPELACYGKDHIQSPNIDRIAKAGMVFDRAYCQQAVCSPSRSSLMTGTRPDTTKVWDLVTHFRAALPHVATLGQHFKNHGYFVQGMGKIYHGGYDDPQTWSVPGMKNAGQHTRALVEFVDIYPTLSELAGLPLPPHLEGTSFKPLLDDPNRPWKTAAFSQYPRPGGRTGAGQLMGYSMRTDRYRFTAWMTRADPTMVVAQELYDHQTDPQENQNLAGRPENAARVRALTATLNAGWKAARPK